MTSTVEASASPAYAAELQLIPLAELHESALNPRKYFPAGPLQELADSIAKSGIRTPLIARSRLQGGGYEIAAGHRRLRAAKIAGVAHAPVMVREMSDAEFLEVLTFENGQREDVHPLEEAAGYQVFMRETLASVADVAAKTGKSGSYVYGRLKLLELTGEGLRAFWDGKISAGHAELIARLEPVEQAKPLKFALTPNWQGVTPSVRALADYLHQSVYVDLRDCPFDLLDPALVSGAGACGPCPKRAANIPGFEFNPEDPEADLCTDRACHQQKLDNHLVQLQRSLEANGEKPLAVSGDWSTRKKGVLAKADYVAVPATHKDARQAVVVDGTGVGQVITVKVKAARPAESRSAPPSKAESAKAENERKAKVEQELSIRRAILDATRQKVGGLTRADFEATLAALLQYNDGDADMLCGLHGIKCKQYQGGNALIAALPKFKEAELYQIFLEMALVEELDEWAAQRDPEPKRLLAFAKRYKVDAAKIRSELEEKAKEAEGGTRKEVIQQRPVAGAAAKKTAPAKKAAKKKAGKK